MSEKNLNSVPQDVPVSENVESSKLEWGPEFYRGCFPPENLGEEWTDSFYKSRSINRIIETENSSLKQGEKPWRLPTKDELLAMFNEEHLIKDHGYQGEDYYWTYGEGEIWLVNRTDGSTRKYGNDTEDVAASIRLVR